MAEADELFNVRTLYWIGNFQGAINEANGLNKLKPHLKEEKEEYVYRSFIGLGQYAIVASEIGDSSSVPIGKRAIKLLALYLENPTNRERAIAQLQSYLSDPSTSQNKTLQLIAATLYMSEENNKESFRYLKDAATLEQHALLIQLYLKMYRADLAQKQLKTMKSVDEDSVLSMIATAWVHLSSNKFQDASYIYEELIDKYGSTSMLLNGLAVSKMHQGQFDEAETSLQEALTKNQGDPDALANLIVVSTHLHRAPEVLNRYFSQLRMKSPGHPLLVSFDAFNSSFDRASAAIH